jgi:hypothetical protein
MPDKKKDKPSDPQPPAHEPAANEQGAPQDEGPLPKAYDPATVENRIYAMWEQGGYFHAEPDAPGKPFTIVIPPPNVTDRLHLGHALNNTLQDILIRWRRMQGRKTLWVPGTDHAVARRSSGASGRGARSAATSSSTNSSASAHRATGSGRGSPLTRSVRGRCGTRSSRCSRTA